MRGPGTTRPAADPLFRAVRRASALVLCAGLSVLLAGAAAQLPPAQAPPPPPPAGAGAAPKKEENFSIRRTVNLVVLHTAAVDDRGHFVDGLRAENFKVLENKVAQKISVFKREDIPVSMGLVIDNSGSMREKRPKVNEAAITLVQASNPQDEAFVVNFNDDFYLDLDKDFTSSIPELKEALERIDSRGSTALYDAIIGSLDHVKKGKKDKKVLLVVTDGDDTASRNTLENTIKEIQKSEVLIYTIGVLGEEEKKTKKRARRALKEIAEASGGLAFFPESLEEVHTICEEVAKDIRNQYVLAYYPTNGNQDGTFRAIQVSVVPPRGQGKITARTRNGYYAPGAKSGANRSGP